MNINQALMIVRNASSGYTASEIRTAAAYVLGSLDATDEDQLDAANALGYVDQMGVNATYPPGARCGQIDDHPFSGAVSAGDY